MGIFARTMEVSKFALGINTLLENLPGPAFMGPADQPHVAPPFRSLMERTEDIILDLHMLGEAKYSDEAFAARHGGNMPTITQSVTQSRPEATDGTLVQTRA